MAFKTTHIDTEKPLREGAFSFTRRTLFPPLDKRNTRDKAKGLRISSARHIGELGVRYLSTLNRGQDSKATVAFREHAGRREKRSPTASLREGSRGADAWWVNLAAVA